MARLLVEIGEGRHHAAQSIALGDLCGDWLEQARASLEPNTAREFAGVLRRYLGPRTDVAVGHDVLRRGIGGTPLKKLRAWELDRFYQQLLVGGGRNGTPLSPATVRKVHTVLRLALEQAVRWQWLAENPALHASPPSVTQDYLIRLLSRSGYDGQIVLFNGSNSDPESIATYQRWKERHQGSDQLSGSPTADMRAALVERFRSEAKITIATEAAAEGINLQFCSMVVNYDLPWNPQRIEQRIGRCHRYGQRHDVVVINFLNRANAADLRVFELLDEKFRLFSGLFGASDELLGAIESGVDDACRGLVDGPRVGDVDRKGQ